MGWDMPMERTFLLISPEYTERMRASGTPRSDICVRQQGSKVSMIPNSPGSLYCTQCFHCCQVEWGNDPWGWLPQRASISSQNHPSFSLLPDFLLPLSLHSPVVGEGFAAHPTCWVRGPGNSYWGNTRHLSQSSRREEQGERVRRQGTCLGRKADSPNSTLLSLKGIPCWFYQGHGLEKWTVT